MSAGIKTDNRQNRWKLLSHVCFAKYQYQYTTAMQQLVGNKNLR
jgi:hypothetical protein